MENKFTEDNFVSYEIAVKLKELDFDEECLAYFNTDPKLKRYNFVLSKSIKHEHCLPTPTQSQLQTWLRNKKILVEVRPVDDWSSWCYSIFMEDCISPFFEVKNNNEYPSYEDALEAGLYEGLTNIK